jgi:hypothetical protein
MVFYFEIIENIQYFIRFFIKKTLKFFFSISPYVHIFYGYKSSLPIWAIAYFYTCRCFDLRKALAPHTWHYYGKYAGLICGIGIYKLRCWPLKDWMYLEWPNWFWAASYDLTLFLVFLKLFVKMRVGISFVWAQISRF